MNLQEAIGILEVYHDWQLDKTDDYVYQPKELSKAIEVVLAQVKKSIRLKSRKEIAMRIREIRMAHNFTQVYVAKQIGVSQPEYSKLENAHRKKPNMELLSKLSELFEVSMNEFLQ